MFLLLWLGGGKVGGAVTLVKGGGGGDGDRDFPDSAASVLFRSCDFSGRVQDGVQASSDDGVTNSEMTCSAETYYSTWLSTWRRDSEAQGSSALMKCNREQAMVSVQRLSR